MILREHNRILIFGMTGKQGSYWSQAMIDYGAKVIGGVNPAKGNTMHLKRPVYASAQAATADQACDSAVMFVPPMAAGSAMISACEAGIRLIVCLTEHIPLHDVMEALAAAKANGATVFGPNTAGLVTPGESFAGIMPAFNSKIFGPGKIGVISRSGSLGTLICLELKQSGYGQSAFLGVGGDPIVGTTTAEALHLLDRDPGTEGVVICGEIGGTAEEEAADYATTMTKPVVAFIAGRSAPPDKKMGHAGAIMTGNFGSYRSKRKAFESAGVPVAEIPSQIPDLLDAKFAHQQRTD